jgi:tetratricopeptide (TPR) repeat protein
MRGNSMRRKVLQLAEEGLHLHYEGELDDAIDRYELACALVRESIGKQKDEADPDSLQQLGSMLYAQGEWLLENGEYQPALDALAEAEQSYARLGPRVPAQLVTDVVLRRARVLMAAGRRLSAMAEAQRAMIRALEPVASDTGGLARR